MIPALSIATSVPVPIAIPTARGRERGRVVDAVAGHRDDLALGLQASHHLGLARRKHVCLDPVDPDRAGDGLRGDPVVAGQHHDLEALGAQRADRFGALPA